MPHIADCEQVTSNIARLIQSANVLQVPVVATEQYPQGLGATVAQVREHIETDCIEKITFSCMGDDGARDRLAALAKPQVLVCGVEAHVCIQQTVFDLMAEGYRVFVAGDAISSRSLADCGWAVRRMESCGAVFVSTEACMFEWCERAGTEIFQKIRKLI